MRVRTKNLWLHYSNTAPSAWVRTAAACLDDSLAALCLKHWASYARMIQGSANERQTALNPSRHGDPLARE